MRWALFAIVILVIFTVFVTAFAAAADKRQVRQLPKWAWVLLCLFVTPIGGVAYLLIGRPVPKTQTDHEDPTYLKRLADRLREEDENKDKDE